MNDHFDHFAAAVATILNSTDADALWAPDSVFDIDRAVSALAANPAAFIVRDNDNDPDGEDSDAAVAARHLILTDGPWWVTWADDDSIEELFSEAAYAGDMEQVRLCRDALDGDESALAECSRVIARANSENSTRDV